MTATLPSLASVKEGFRTQYRYDITTAVHQKFIEAFHDTNRLHVDDEFARGHGFPAPVIHGGVLNGFISHFVGVHFPGDGALEHSVNIQYKSPSHVGDEILIESTVSHVSMATGAMIMDMVLTNITRNRVAAKAKVQVGIA